MPAPDPALEGRLTRFLDLLQQWNSRINLVADAKPEVIRTRHIADSLQLAGLLPASGGALADLGSGAGFPGLILAMATDRPIHLVESDRRKAAFLTEAAAQLGLRHVTIHPLRAEAARLPPLQTITARALAPLAELLPHAWRFLAPDGCAIFPKGRTAERELTAAEAAWTFEAERFASHTDPEATILRLTKIRPHGQDR
jgi:16S rRNA (guanine527-N7)-methyltransferase